MFLKFLDDLDRIHEEESILSGEPFRATLDAPYRWRDWAAPVNGLTGEDLIAFINQDEAIRSNGERGPGLFAYLRSLSGTDRRNVIASVFRGTYNRMVSGYLLRDVVNKVGGIHFDSSEEIHTLGALYESMLKEMRDAAPVPGRFVSCGHRRTSRPAIASGCVAKARCRAGRPMGLYRANALG
jgi:type I restriction enzyme M protein